MSTPTDCRRCGRPYYGAAGLLCDECERRATRTLMVVVPDGKTIWKDGEIEKAIEEKVAEGPVLHLNLDAAEFQIQRVKKLDPETMAIVSKVWPGISPPAPKGKTEDGKIKLEILSEADYVRTLAPGFRHVIGLTDLSLKLAITHPGVTVNWQYPEQLLHPAHQYGITDILLLIIETIKRRREAEGESHGKDQNQ